MPRKPEKPACPCWASCFPELYKYCDPKKPPIQGQPPVWVLPQQPGKPPAPKPPVVVPSQPVWPVPITPFTPSHRIGD